MRRLRIATDDFNRADSIDLGAAWDTYDIFTNLQIVGNRVRAGATGGNDTLESYNAVTVPNDQWAEVTLATVITPPPIYTVWGGVVLRAATPPTTTMYVLAGGVDSGSGLTSVYKWIAGVFTSLASDTQTWVSGDVALGEAQGTALRIYRNGTLQLSATDSSITDGRLGAKAAVGDGGALTDIEIDGWSGGRFGPRQLLLGVGH